MKKSTLIKAGFAVCLILFSNITLSSESNNVSEHNRHIQAQRDFIVGCSQYVVGAQNLSQSEKKNILEYLNYLHILSPDLDIIVNDITDHYSNEKIVDIQRYIKSIGLNREQGVTYCALNSIKAIENIKSEVNEN